MRVCVCAYCEFVTCHKSMLYLYFIDLGSRLHIRIFLKSSFWIRNRSRGRFSYVFVAKRYCERVIFQTRAEYMK